MRLAFALPLSVLLLLAGDGRKAQSIADSDWPAYGRDSGGQRYSPLTQITPGNVDKLKVAWTVRTGDSYQPERGSPTRFQATPLFVDGVLYVSTPLGRVLALDPSTGRQRWAFDSHVPRDGGYGDFGGRGVATWKSQRGERRIYLATIDARLIAIDAASGKLCSGFGNQGVINLRTGLRLPPRDFSEYEQTSPPAIIGDTVVVGSAIADNGATTVASGEVRGYDAQTGALRWTWDPLQKSSTTGSLPGAANAWSVIAVDEARNLVFVPTGSASPDYYGGERPGDNRWSNSITALQGDTGKLVWSYQTIHHDLWDYDVASPPILFPVELNGRSIPAIAVGSKSASFFILNRETGQPVFPVEERPVPASDVPGERAWPTQPFSTAPPPVSPQRVNASEAWGISVADRDWCRNEISSLRNEGVFTPPSVRGTLVYPGVIGGLAWSGAAFDPAHHLLVFPANNIATEMFLIPRDQFDNERSTGARKLNGEWEFAPQKGTPFGMRRRLLVTPKGMPCTAPPWGTLQAIDSNTGKLVWKVPIGQAHADLPEDYGSPALGGPISTASGLTFAAGTLDPNIRAYQTASGKLLWKGALPTSARATPMTFRAPDGKQYLVICAGSHKPVGDAPLGDYIVAFSL